MGGPLSVRLAALAAAALALSCPRGGATREAPPLFSLEDPRGDDHGDGQIAYPVRDDLQDGDLDLLRVEARAGREGTDFELTFAHAVRRPDARAVDISGTALTDVAKLGFYTFNVDLYVDTDRVEGSGRRAMLPGRLAEVTADGAWEKVICLTPRPADAREELRRLWLGEKVRERRSAGGQLDPSTEGFLQREVEREIQGAVFFPTRVHVSGPSLTFTVPRSFFGGVASPEWGYVIAVTAADIATKVHLKSLLGLEQAQGGLMIVPLGSIANAEHLGGGRAVDPWEPPILDLIVPPGRRQEEVLTGPTRKIGERVQVPPVIPAGQPPPPPPPPPPEAADAGSPGGGVDAGAP
ncbi:MAG TPA: glucodextranase DOMON-like domain-containing protein [Myxococcaceae bacterium]|nr:glucodextranase DOMON-like domain-containing protein [Myxococcaceae bacterium]